MSTFTETIALEDKVSPAASAASRQMSVLSSAIAQTESALTLAAASGNVKKYNALQKDLAGYKSALDQIPPALKEEVSAAQASMAAEAKQQEALKVTQRVLAEQASAFKKYEDDKKKAQAAAWAESDRLNRAEQAKQQQALESKLKAQKEHDAAVSAARSQALQDTKNAMQIGKETVEASIAGMKNAFAALASGDVKGAIAGVTESVASLAKMLDLVVPGLGQAAATVITIAGGLVGITAGLIKSGIEFTIASVEAKNASIALFDALGQGAIAGDDVDEMLDGLRAKLGVTKETLGQFTTGFLKMGITGKESLEYLTTAAASAEALVKGGGQAFVDLQEKINAAANSGQKLVIPFKKLTSQLSAMGLNAEDVASAMGMTSKAMTEGLAKGTINASKFSDALSDAASKKGAGPLEALAASSANLGAMLKEYIGDLFEDLKEPVGAFMKQVKSLFGIFESKTTPSGMALKSGIEGAFKGILAAATAVVPYVKHFLLDLVILGLKAYIGLKPLIKWIGEMAEKKPVVDAFWMTLKGLGSAVAAMVAPIAIVIGLVAALSAAFALATGFAASVVGVIMNFGAQVFGTLSKYIAQAMAWGTDFVNGIVQGITSGVGLIVNAVTGLATSAKDAFTKTLGIASPAKAMIGPGRFTAEGVAVGMDQGIGDVEDASSNLAAAASNGFTDSAPGVDAPTGTPAAKGSGISVDRIEINVSGGNSAATAMELTEQGLTLALERVALAGGLI